MTSVDFFEATRAEMLPQCFEIIQAASLKKRQAAADHSWSLFFERTRAPMSMLNWETNVNNHPRKSAEAAIALQLKKKKLKRKRAQQMADGAFDEDAVHTAVTKAQKSVSAGEQKMHARAKRRQLNTRIFPLGEETGESLLQTESSAVAITDELTVAGLIPTKDTQELQGDLDQLISAANQQNQTPEEFPTVFANVGFIVGEATRKTRGPNGGALATMGAENIAEQVKGLSTVSEVYSAAFMEQWLCEADPKRNERPCYHGVKCEGAMVFMPHLATGVEVPPLREFLVFEERLQFSRTGELPSHPRICLLCKLKAVHLGWILNATMLESQDYRDKHCAFENLFDIPGEFISLLSLNNPPKQFFGLPGPVLAVSPDMLRPARRPGSERLLALKFVEECLMSEADAQRIQGFHTGLAASTEPTPLSTLCHQLLVGSRGDSPIAIAQ